MEIVVVIVAGGLLVLWFVNRVIKASQIARGRDRCAFCRARLRFMGAGKAGQEGAKAGYATTCSKCGREQPWA